MHTAQALLTMLGAHHDVPKHQANYIGIPNGIPAKKQNHTFLFKSLSWELCSDYPGTSKKDALGRLFYARNNPRPSPV